MAEVKYSDKRSYLPGNINVDSSTPFSLEKIQNFIERREDRKFQRESRDLQKQQQVLALANQKWQQEQVIKNENMEKAYNTWSSKGLDMSNALGGNVKLALSSSLPSFADQWKGYSESAQAAGVTPNMQQFYQGVNQNNLQYMNILATRLNSVYDSLRQDWPNVSDNEIYKEMQREYSADNIYKNLQLVGGDVNNLKYLPPQTKIGWGDWAKSFFIEPTIEGDGKIKPAGSIVGTGVLAGGIYGGKQMSDTIKKGSDAYLKKAEENFGKMKSKEWEKTYGEKKRASATGELKKTKTTKFKASDKILQHAKRTGQAETTLGKAAQWMKGKSKSPGNIAKTGLPYLAPTVGEAIGGVVGDTGGDIGRTVGVVTMAKALDTPKKAKSFWKFLSRKVPSILGKAGTIALAESPAPGIGDLLALGLTAQQLVSLYTEWTSED